MKKICSLLLCLMLLCALAVTVFGADTPQMELKAEKTTLKPGDTVTVTLSVTEVEECTAGGFVFEFDEKVFTYVEGKVTDGVSEYTIKSFTTAGGRYAGAFGGGTHTICADLFLLTLKVRDDAPSGQTTLTGTPALKVSGQSVTCGVTEAAVTVEGTAEPDTSEQTPADTEQSQDQEDVQQLPGSNDGCVVLPDVPEEQTGTTAQDTQHTPAVQEEPDVPAFPWWIVLVAVCAVAAGAVLFYHKKK